MTEENDTKRYIIIILGDDVELINYRPLCKVKVVM